MIDRPQKDMYGALVLTERLSVCKKYPKCYKTSQRAFKVPFYPFTYEHACPFVHYVRKDYQFTHLLGVHVGQ